MNSKKGKTRKPKTGHELEVKADAMRLLRTLNPSESFHFYEAIGKPTGQRAANLREFLDTVKSVKTESLQFHLERKDFQNWIEKTLGDTTLAKRIASTNTKHEGNIRTEIQSILEKRIRELTEPTLTITVNREQTVTRREIQV